MNGKIDLNFLKITENFGRSKSLIYSGTIRNYRGFNAANN